MGLIRSSGSNQPTTLIWNLCQKAEFTDPHLVGVEEDSYLKHAEGGELRKMHEWYPKDAVTRDEAKTLQKTSVKPDMVIPFAPGELSPYPVKLLLPDGAQDLAEDVKKATAQDGDVTLGVFLQKLVYRYTYLEDALQIVQRKEPELMDRFEDLIESELDEEQLNKLKKLLDSFEDVNKKSSKKKKKDKDD